MSDLLQRIKSEHLEARKRRQPTQSGILSVLLGEIQNLQASPGQRGDVQDGAIIRIIRKLIAGNEDLLLKADEQSELHAKLVLENMLLDTLLPQMWSQEQIVEWLSNKHGRLIREQKSDGPATGIALKLLNSCQCPVEGNVVAQAVKEIRNAS